MLQVDNPLLAKARTTSWAISPQEMSLERADASSVAAEELNSRQVAAHRKNRVQHAQTKTVDEQLKAVQSVREHPSAQSSAARAPVVPLDGVFTHTNPVARALSEDAQRKADDAMKGFLDSQRSDNAAKPDAVALSVTESFVGVNPLSSDRIPTAARQSADVRLLKALPDAVDVAVSAQPRMPPSESQNATPLGGMGFYRSKQQQPVGSNDSAKAVNPIEEGAEASVQSHASSSQEEAKSVSQTED